ANCHCGLGPRPARSRSSGRFRSGQCRTRARSPSWTSGGGQSLPARRPGWGGCSGTLPSTTAAPTPRPGGRSRAAFRAFPPGRGGQFTYHGPGQRVAYVMLDLKRRTPDIRCFVAALEEWIIRSVAAFGVAAERREDRIGAWVARPEKGAANEDKIAAIGVRLRRWISLHGIALNVAPELAHFSGVVPCGGTDPRYGVTSLADLGRPAAMDAVDQALRREFERIFGATETAADPLLRGSLDNRSIAVPDGSQRDPLRDPGTPALE